MDRAAVRYSRRMAPTLYDSLGVALGCLVGGAVMLPVMVVTYRDGGFHPRWFFGSIFGAMIFCALVGVVVERIVAAVIRRRAAGRNAPLPSPQHGPHP